MFSHSADPFLSISLILFCHLPGIADYLSNGPNSLSFCHIEWLVNRFECVYVCVCVCVYVCVCVCVCVGGGDCGCTVLEVQVASSLKSPRPPLLAVTSTARRGVGSWRLYQRQGIGEWFNGCGGFGRAGGVCIAILHLSRMTSSVSSIEVVYHGVKV